MQMFKTTSHYISLLLPQLNRVSFGELNRAQLKVLRNADGIKKTRHMPGESQIIKKSFNSVTNYNNVSQILSKVQLQ